MSQRCHRPWFRLKGYEALFVSLPTTGEMIHHWVEEDQPSSSVHVYIVCPRCTRLHIINRTTGKPLGDDDTE